MIDELKDVRPPVDLPPNYTLLFILGAVLLLVLLFVILKFLDERFKKERNSPVIVRPAWEVAHEELAALKAEDLPAKGEVKEYFFRLSGVVRHYLERRFDLSAPEMTTDEFLLHLKNTDVLNSDQKESLREFLTASDMVKFARYGSNAQEMEKAFDVAKRLVEETTPAGNSQQPT